MTDQFTGQWAILPAMVRYDKALPANAKLIYAEVAAKINEEGFCFCYNKYFADRLALKPDTVSNLIKRLEDAGYIMIDVDATRVNSDKRRIYLTGKPYDFSGGIGFKSGTENKSEGVSEINPIPIENRDIKYNTPLYPPKGGRRESKREAKKEPDWQPERFKAFWAAYPRGESKQAAIAAWDKLHADEGLLDLMAAALKRQLSSSDWQRGIGIPYASTWLNQRRWEDEDHSLPVPDLAPVSQNIEIPKDVDIWT